MRHPGKSNLRSAVFAATILFVQLLGCTGAQETFFEIKGSSIAAIDPSSLSSMTSKLDARVASTVTQTSNIVSEWASQEGDSFSAAPGKEPVLADKYMRFDSGDMLTATGRNPAHLSKNFTFLFVGIFDHAGFKFRLGSDDLTEAMTITKSGPQELTLEHSTSSGNKRSRIWSSLPSDGLPHVIAVTFGEATKDLELYVDGFRKATYASAGAGSAGSFQMIARDFVLTNTGSQEFQLGEFYVFNSKLGPRDIYAVTRSVATSWKISIASSVTKEIRENLLPAIEPESVDANYIFSAILTAKCVTCHQTGGNSPFFANESELRAARTVGNALILVPGNSAMSPLFTSVDNNSMPFGGSPLSTSEKKLIQDWINNGAP